MSFSYSSEMLLLSEFTFVGPINSRAKEVPGECEKSFKWKSGGKFLSGLNYSVCQKKAKSFLFF